MKTLVTIFALCTVLLTGTVSAANPTVLTIKTDSEIKLEHELSRLAAYPKVFGQRSQGEVVVRFTIDAANRISNVRVLGASQEVSDRLARQLNGKRLKSAQYAQFQPYTIRLKYQTV